jgi:hypothetical protein
MLCDQWQRARWWHRTVGADKGYDTFDFVHLMRELGTTPQVMRNLTRRGGSAIDGRTTRHAGYAKSQHARPRIEPAFGWLKTIACDPQGQTPWSRQRRLALRVRECCVQPSSTTTVRVTCIVALPLEPPKSSRGRLYVVLRWRRVAGATGMRERRGSETTIVAGPSSDDRIT